MSNAVLIIAISTLSALTLDESTSEWRLANKNMEVSISKSECEIVAIAIKGNRILIAPLDIRLPLQPVGEQETIKNISVENNSPRSLIVRGTRESRNAVLNFQYTLDNSKLVFEVDVLGKFNRETELRIDYCLPILQNMQFIFFPDGNQPVLTRNFGKKQLVYRTDMAIPFCTFYNNTSNYGVTIYSPLEIIKPWLAFMTDSRNLIVSYQHLRLSAKKSIKVAITVIPHGGDWRPGLNAILSEYPDYFHPVSEHVLEGEGWYYLADAFDSEEKIKELGKTHVTWAELHGHFPFYGLYMPETSEWGIIFDSAEYSLNDWSKGLGRKKNSYARMVDAIDIWHRYGIQVYLYFQCFEAWYQYAQRYFDRSIARDKYGNPLKGWTYTQLMNPDPIDSWGKHVEQQITEIMKIYPSIDGIFYDRMDYWQYDYAHDDGITMVNNKPSYTLSFAQQRMNEKIFQILHAKNKAIWGNGPASIEVCKNLDGVMAERHLSNLFRLQYLAINRPIIFLAYDREPKQTEDKLKNALLCGAFPSITYGNDQCKQLDQKYRPLFDLIRNRKWVLYENAIKVPKKFLSNIFQTPNGNYVVVIIDPKKSQLDRTKPSYKIPIIVRIPDAEGIENAQLLSADWPGTKRLDFEEKDSSLYLTLSEHLTTSLIYLSHER